MATTGIVNGTNLRWFLDGVAVMSAKSGQLSFAKETKERVHKDTSGSWAEKRGGKKSFNGSCEAYYEEGSAFESFWASFDSEGATEELDMEYGTAETGDKIFNCKVIITSMEHPSEADEDVTYSISFDGTGRPTRTVNA